MARFIMLSLAVLASLIVSAPLYYAINPEPTPELPPPGRSIPVGDGMAVNAIESGPKHGAPMVLVHGLPGTGYDWRPLVDGLAERGHRVLAYDRVGYGHSDPRADGEFTLAANARELLALLDAEDLADVTVLGWSYGGGTAIQAARRDSSRIGRLVLIGSAGPLPLDRERPLVARLILTEPVLRWVGMVPPVRRAIQKSASDQAFSDQSVPDWWLPQVAANFASPHTARSWVAEGAAFSIEGLDPAPIRRPILVLHGADDRLVPLDVAEAIDRQAPDSELRVVDGGSHMLPVTHSELLSGWISEFAGRGGVRTAGGGGG